MLASLWHRVLPISMPLLMLSCNPYAEIEADRKKFPRLSATRPIGSACAVNDSASITRRRSHPLHPTGGWDSTIENTANQTPHGTERGLMEHHNTLTGFVQFPEAGELRARSYDDTYGSVYCGWSPAKVALEASDRPSQVRLGRCSVGDGGLDQVHEVCWFAAGQSAGKLIYSSAHPAPAFNPVDLYRAQDLGGRNYFNDRLAFSTIEAALKLKDISLASQVLGDSFEALGRMENLVEGSSGKAIPARQFHRDHWVRLMAVRLGLSLGQPDFAGYADALEAELRLTLPYHCNSCQRLESRLAQYRALHQLKGESARAYFQQHFSGQLQEFETAASAVLFRD